MSICKRFTLPYLTVDASKSALSLEVTPNHTNELQETKKTIEKKTKTVQHQTEKKITL